MLGEAIPSDSDGANYRAGTRVLRKMRSLHGVNCPRLCGKGKLTIPRNAKDSHAYSDYNLKERRMVQGIVCENL